MRSIANYLLAWIIGSLLSGSVLIALVTYAATLDEMNEVFDADLKNVAQSMGRYHQSAYAASRQDELVLPLRSDEPRDVEIVTMVWTNDARRLYASDPRVRIPFSSQEGLSKPIVGGEQWIVYSSIGERGVAQAAQRTAQRHQMAAESGVKMFSPMLLLVIVVGGLLLVGLRRALKPLDAAARDVATRSARSLDPISGGAAPREIKPLVNSINGLLSRLATSFTAQRRFLADAAHELRTPVTALRLQVQLLRRSPDVAGQEQALRELEEGINRSQRLIEQLLAVARSEPDGAPLQITLVDLAALVRSTVGAFSLMAEQMGIDLGAGTDLPIRVEADAEQLQVLLNNLVENALRYTPREGVVDVEVSVNDAHAILTVTDDGPGISEQERERVFDRFYRSSDVRSHAPDATGSGLGLSIVRAIAERHGASVTLCTPLSGTGLRVEVRFRFPDPS